MFYVYVIKSAVDNKLYVGYTNDLKRRILEHNENSNISTKYRTPFALVYYEAYLSQRDAKNRESNLKVFGGAMTHLRKRIYNSMRQTK